MSPDGTPSANHLIDFLAGQLADTETGWSLGTFGVTARPNSSMRVKSIHGAISAGSIGTKTSRVFRRVVVSCSTTLNSTTRCPRIRGSPRGPEFFFPAFSRSTRRPERTQHAAGLRERGRSGLRPELLQRCVTLFFSSCDEQQRAYIGVVLRNGRQSSISFFA
jgi:hypothetical protein